MFFYRFHSLFHPFCHFRMDRFMEQVGRVQRGAHEVAWQALEAERELERLARWEAEEEV
jgi:cation transport regulator ChaB